MSISKTAELYVQIGQSFKYGQMNSWEEDYAGPNVWREAKR